MTARSGGGPSLVAPLLQPGSVDPPRVSTGLPDLDRVLGGGLVAGSVVLLAGPPGIGKSTLLLQWLSSMATGGSSSLLVSGEESRAQVAARARRLGVPVESVTFAPGRDLHAVLGAARETRPDVLAVDSVQTLRDVEATTQPGGVAQVRACTDALVELAKQEDIAVLLAGHVTKDGDLAGPRALEHAVDVVLTFEGDPRSGLRIVSGGKNRFGTEGETAWFQMGATGLGPSIPPTCCARANVTPARRWPCRWPAAERSRSRSRPWSGVATAPVAGRSPASISDGSNRSRRWSSATPGCRSGAPSCSARSRVASGSTIRPAISPWRPRSSRPPLGVAPPAGAAFVGEIALTGQVRAAPGMEQRVSAARAAGCAMLFAPAGLSSVLEGLRVVTVGHMVEALGWGLSPARTHPQRQAS